jgi:tRNA/rRNA methyltransferase
MWVVLVEPEYSGNLGLVARAVKNFGASGLVLLKPKADIGKARKRAMHAQDILDKALVVNDWEELRKKFSYLVGTTAMPAGEYNVNRACVAPGKIPKVNNMAVVFGRESTGLTNSELEKCDAVCRIPTSEKYRTMNVTHAVAIVLYETSKVKSEKKIASVKLRNQLYKFWGEILSGLDYPADKKKTQSLLFRRTLERAAPGSREAYGMAGVMSKVLKRLKPKD